MKQTMVRTVHGAARMAAAAMLPAFVGLAAASDPLSNQYSSAVLRPPDYDTFRPPPAGQSFRDPVFGTEIEVITDAHNIVGWNGERASFSQDDKYFFVGVKPGRDQKSEVWLYDGRTGAFIKSIPIEQFDNVRWGYDPKTLVYFTTNQVRGYHVETDADTLIHEFAEPLGNGKGRVCGGDGNDFDDKGEWILLNFGTKVWRMFAFNIRTGETGPEWTCPDPKADIDYATISPSGRYAVLVAGQRGSALYRGVGLYERTGAFVRQLVPFGGHAECGYLHGTDECVVLKVGKGWEDWRAKWGLNARDRLGVSFATGSVTKLFDQGTIYGQIAAVGGSNRRFIYWAMESDNEQPARGWGKYTGEIVEVPLDGSQRVRRLLHHRCRPWTTDEPHTWGDQPELWINHAGDRLFFRSNMCLAQGSTAQKYGHDLFLVKIPPRAPAP